MGSNPTPRSQLPARVHIGAMPQFPQNVKRLDASLPIFRRDLLKPKGAQAIEIEHGENWTLIRRVYAAVIFFMRLKMSLAEIIIAIRAMPCRQCITNYALSNRLVIVIMLTCFVVLLHGENILC